MHPKHPKASDYAHPQKQHNQPQPNNHNTVSSSLSSYSFIACRYCLFFLLLLCGPAVDPVGTHRAWRAQCSLFVLFFCFVCFDANYYDHNQTHRPTYEHITNAGQMFMICCSCAPHALTLLYTAIRSIRGTPNTHQNRCIDIE